MEELALALLVIGGIVAFVGGQGKGANEIYILGALFTFCGQCQLLGVSNGQTLNEVRQALGEPNIQMNRSGTLKYVYSRGKVEFKEGLVVGFSSELNLPEVAKATVVTTRSSLPDLNNLVAASNGYSLFKHGEAKKPSWSEHKNSFESMVYNIKSLGRADTNFRTPYAGTYHMVCFGGDWPVTGMDLEFSFTLSTHVADSNHARIFEVALIDLGDGLPSENELQRSNDYRKLRNRDILLGLDFVFTGNTNFDAYMHVDKGIRGGGNHRGARIKRSLPANEEHKLRLTIAEGWGIIHLDGKKVYERELHSDYADIGIYMQLVGGRVSIRNGRAPILGRYTRQLKGANAKPLTTIN